MTEPTYIYLDEPRDPGMYLLGIIATQTGAAREAVAAWEQWTEARSFDEHTAAATRLDAAMRALREVAT